LGHRVEMLGVPRIGVALRVGRPVLVEGMIAVHG
jgi:hypothetical protein